MHAFLIGGGAGSPAAHRPFADAALAAGAKVGPPGAARPARPVVVYLLDEPDGEEPDRDRWIEELRAVGLDRGEVVVVSPDRPPAVDDLDGAAGVYVAGGWTPGYRDVLVDGGTDWLEPVRTGSVPYAGFSAGSSIAAEHALVGGWRVERNGRAVPVCHEDVGEDLDLLTIGPGLAVVPFLVDVHAAQWGTLHRLVHALSIPGTPDVGWAIDEATALEVVDGVPVAVHGDGAATRVRRVDSAGGTVEVTVVTAGESLPSA